MARTFGKLLCTIWADPDFLALTPNAKVLYAAFISQPDISPAGLLPMTERRWRKWIDGTAQSVDDALDELVERRFIITDDDTAEVWLRSFIRHDGRLDNSKLAVSVHAAVPVIRSPRIYSALHTEYPGIFPDGRGIDRPSDSPSNPHPIEPQSAIEPASDVTDLNQDLDLDPPPDPNRSAITSADIATAGGIVYAKNEAANGRAKDERKLAAWKADQLALHSRKELDRLAKWNAAHRAWSSFDIPLDVLGAAAIGDTHSLAHFPDTPPVVIEEPERIDRAARLTLLKEAGAPDRFIDSEHTEDAS